MPRITLFRVQAYQGDSDRPLSSNPSDLLRQVITAKPSVGTGKTTTWRVANIESIDDNWMYFRLGKTTTTKNEEFKNGNFVELASDASPSTHSFVHFPLELLGITQKSAVASSIYTIARRFEELLNAAPETQQKRARFEVRVIRDPEGFIKALKSAAQVTKFWFNVSLPNAIDEDGFAEAASQFVEDTNAASGKIEVKGEELNVTVLESEARVAISLGNETSASVANEKGGPTHPIYSKRQNSADLPVDKKDLTDPARRNFVVGGLLALYKKVRGVVS
jgi:hypothetical protein